MEVCIHSDKQAHTHAHTVYAFLSRRYTHTHIVYACLSLYTHPHTHTHTHTATHTYTQWSNNRSNVRGCIAVRIRGRNTQTAIGQERVQVTVPFRGQRFVYIGDLDLVIFQRSVRRRSRGESGVLRHKRPI